MFGSWAQIVVFLGLNLTFLKENRSFDRFYHPNQDLRFPWLKILLPSKKIIHNGI